MVYDYSLEAPAPHVPLDAPTTMPQHKMLQVLLVGGLLMATAIGVLLVVSLRLLAGQHDLDQGRARSAADTETTLLANRENGFRSRAATCEGQYALGLRFRPQSPCLSRDVRRYWDPQHLTAYRPTGR